MPKINCWQFKKCGREPGGAKVAEMGVCPAASEKKLDGINKGINAGRACWVVAGTYCQGKVQGSFALKVADCMNCEFFKLVVREEGRNYCGVLESLKKLKDNKKE